MKKWTERLIIVGFTLLLLPVVGAPLFAAGQSDAEPTPVDGQSHWTHTVDLEELEEGKYNIVIQATDEAGNVRLEGPYDFRVDPETDIPLVAISHPKPGMRVGRMLPIIGTARDDDAVSRVEVQINDGPWRPASGAESWSAVLDAESLGEGPQVMNVKAVDIKGIESPVITVPFVVDTSAPVGGVTEPVSGALIAGKADFSGIIEDPNGIEVLEISRDGGETWERQKFSTDKETGAAAFSVTLDSTNLEDGPVVWWFRGVDSQGTSSDVPFLFFVDNKGPEVSIELPLSGEDGVAPVPGNIFLAGTARDLSGVSSLQVIAGKAEPVEVLVIPGNPWWTLPLNLSGIKDKQVDILVLASDGAGNSSEVEIRVPLDLESDLPTFSVDGADTLSEQAFSAGTAYLTGVFYDDDGAGSLTWTAGDLSGRLETVERVWRLDLEELPAGVVEFELIPEDRFGLAGVPLELSFKVAPADPLISIDTIKDNSADAVEEWKPGSILSASGGTISGSVFSDAGKDLLLTYIVSGGEEVELGLKADPENPSRFTFSIPVKKGEEASTKNFILRATDSYGGEAVLGSGFYMQAAPDDAGNVPDPRQGDDKVNLPLPFLREKDGAAILMAGQPLQGWTSGASASGAKLEPESPFLRLRSSGSSFLIESVAPGLSEPVKVVLSDGSSSRQIMVLTDLDAPEWELDADYTGAWSNGVLSISGTVVDAGGVASASWALKGGRSTDVLIEEKGDGRFVFAFDAEFTGQADGPKILVLSAVDAAGNISDYEIPIILDTRAPVLSMALPPADLPVGALSTLVYEISGDEILDEISLTVDGASRTVAEIASLYALDLDLAGYPAIPESMKVRAIDRAGNVAEQVPPVAYDPVSDKPVTHIQTPVAGSVVRGPADIAGLVADDDAIAAVYWRLDGGNWKKLDGNFSFRETLPLSSLVDGTHLLEVYAEDAAGNIGEVDSAEFDITRQEAEVALLTPEVGMTESAVSTLTGTTSDANGIAEVWVSFDNGHTFHLAEGATDFNPPDEADDGESWAEATDGEETPAPGEETASTEETTDTGVTPAESVYPLVRDVVVDWSYAMDTRVLDDGVHTLLIKVVDGAGDEALLAGILDVDNERPILAVGDPREGSVQTGSMILEGRVLDQGGLERFSAVIERDGEMLLEYIELVEGVFHLPFDFSGLEAGEVLLRVEAEDNAGNISAVSRSFIVEPGRRNVVGEIVLPVEGGIEGPYFTFAGFIDHAMESDKAVLVVDPDAEGNGGRELPLELSRRGRFGMDFEPGDLDEGDHVFRVDVLTSDGERSAGIPRTFSYGSLGSWITIEGYPPGMAVGDRPLLSGRTGWYIDAPDEEDKDAFNEYKKALKANRAERVEVSIDGGLSFEKAKGVDEWEYLIETGEMGEGDLPVLVRAQYADEWVYARTLLRLDKTLPDLKMNESIADGRFNDELEVTGTADDDQNLEEVTALVREGSHSRYEVPSFIQGLYVDASFMGGTWFDAGFGLTFFDDNVKLEFAVGYAPEQVKDRDTGELVNARVSGTALSSTLLANVVYLPLGYWWGPKWEPISLSFAIGANFTYFTSFGSGGGGGMMSAVVAQMEIPKISFQSRKFITYLAPYLEGKLWFYSSDVDTTPLFRMSVGIRMGLL